MELYARLLNWLNSEREGQDMVEYALLIGLISVVAIASLIIAGDAVVSLWDAVTSALNSATAAL
jgi:Flp pilus assembly pilin Flp